RNRLRTMPSDALTRISPVNHVKSAPARLASPGARPPKGLASMASGKVARRTVVSDVAALLDSPEIAALIVGIGDAGDKRGRKGYGARARVRSSALASSSPC